MRSVRTQSYKHFDPMYAVTSFHVSDHVMNVLGWTYRFPVCQSPQALATLQDVAIERSLGIMGLMSVTRCVSPPLSFCM